MFAKGYTNIRAMIETQYGILSHMITDIAYRYQMLLKQTEEEADRLAQNLLAFIYGVFDKNVIYLKIHKFRKIRFKRH